MQGAAKQLWVVLTQCLRNVVIKDQNQGYTITRYDHFTGFSEIHRHPATDVRLHLPQPPIGPVRMAHDHARFQHRIEIDHQPNLLGGRVMGGEQFNLLGLLGARLCHDLISPLGAINNGLELLEMTGEPFSPELELIDDSSKAATARLKFFRVAFGRTGQNHWLSPGMIQDALAGGATDPGRFSWPIQNKASKAHVQLVFLCMLCADTVLRKGGTIVARRDDKHMSVRAIGPILAGNEGFLHALQHGEPWPKDMDPARVHFPLARLAARELRMALSVQQREDGLLIEASPIRQNNGLTRAGPGAQL